MNLTTLDFIILGFATLSILIAFWRGLVRTLFGLAAWALSLVASPFLATLIDERFDWGWGLSLSAAFIGLFLLTRLIGSLVARSIVKIGLSSVDRVLGGVFGAARALLMIGFFTMVAHGFKLDHSLAWKQAALAPLLNGIVQWVEPMLPERFGGPIKT